MRAHWEVIVVYHTEDIHPCLLYHVMSSARMLITTHGFQSMSKYNNTIDSSEMFVYLNVFYVGLLFMPRGAYLFELFPFRYFKPTYLILSRQYGLIHEWIQNDSPTFFSRQGTFNSVVH